MFRIYFQKIVLTTCLLAHLAVCDSGAVTAEEPFLPNLIQRCQPKMAKVIGAGVGRVDGYASGFIVSADGLILTAQGVFLEGRQVRVELSDGSSHLASVLRRDRVHKLALLKIEPEKPLDFFYLSSQPVGRKGDWIVALSNAFKVANKSEPLSAMIGVISLRTTIEAKLNKRDYAYRGPLVLIDAITSNPGANGGAVVTTDGELVGMIGKLINSSETNTRINYAVPSSVLKEFVENKQELNPVAASTQKKKAAYLGIVLFKAGGRGDPAYIDRVKRRSPAAKLRLKPDDLIVAIAGKQIGTVKEYEQALGNIEPGEDVALVIKRGAQLLRYTIKPTEKKQ